MRMPMVASVTGALVNIGLDPLLIFGIGPFPEMGVTGAATATVIGQSVQATLMMMVLFKGKQEINVKVRGAHFDRETLKEIYAVGIPAIIMQAIGSVMQFGMNMILAGFSTTAVAVMGVYGRLQCRKCCQPLAVGFLCSEIRAFRFLSVLEDQWPAQPRNCRPNQNTYARRSHRNPRDRG